MYRYIVTKRFFIPLILITITFLTYMNILPNQLFYDDEELIYKNAYVQNLRFLPKYFTSNMIEGAGKTSNMYRPILITSFATDYAIWKNNPFGYHLNSIILHAANGILIFFLIKILFNNELLAFITSIFFLVHPVQSEAVSYASGRTDPLYSFFSLISVLLFLSFVKNGKSLEKYFLSILFFVFALLSKETAIILPLLLTLVYFVIRKKISFNISQLTTIFSPFFLLGIIYIFLRLTIFNFANSLNFYSTANIYSQNIFIRFYTFTRVFFEYIFILLFPKDLVFSRDISPIFAFFNPWVISFLVLFTGFAGISGYFWKRQRILIFILSWFFITILPVSGIIPINSIITEHYLYLPSVAFFTMIAFLINLFIKNSPDKVIRISTVMIVIVIISLLSIRTFIRNSDWRDPITFYSKGIKQSPSSVAMRNNLAMYYTQQDQIDTAIEEYKTTIAIADVYPNTHHNLGNAYKTIKQYELAEKEFKRAIEIDPHFIFSYYALIDLYKITGEKEKLVRLWQILDNLQKL